MPVRRLILLCLFAGLSYATYGQLFNLNPPTITGQRPTPLVTEKNTAITIAFENLRVSDPDILVPPYPQGYTLKVFEGANYSLNNATVTPANGFAGTLTVRVQVNDGKFDSNIFELKIDVINIEPVITGQEAISIKEGSSVTLLLSHLKVDDADNVYPDDFTLKVYDGDNYSINGNTVIPDANFSGDLKVAVTVNDGYGDSDQFQVSIQVKENFIPIIQGQTPLSVDQGKKITLELGHLVVRDDDNPYPTGFTLKVYSGNNYSVSGTTVTPNITFSGILKVGVSVNDGQDDSKKVELNIEVRLKNNVAPTITGQVDLATNEDKSIAITLDNLMVTDPDNTYPDDFTLKIPQGSGAGYAVKGHTVTPVSNYNGDLTIQVRVNDGLADSPPFPLTIRVTPVNDAPVITGQSPISIYGNRTTALEVSRLNISDPDKQNTSTFSLRILSGTNYSANGNQITPTHGFVGELTVRVVVNDGFVDSAPFNLKVTVLPPSSRPLITGQQPLVVNEDESITLELGNLFVTDEDDNFPEGFTMKVLPWEPDTAYSFQGLTVTPALNNSGPLIVNIVVNDGEQDSPTFPLQIYVLPINDAPTIVNVESSLVPYEPGTGPITITEEFRGKDIDNDYLTFAEIRFDSTYDPLHDMLIFENTDYIRGIFDASKGILSLVGHAPIEKYDSAIRSVKYEYILTLDEEGNQAEVLPEHKTIFFTLNDGQLVSNKKTRSISIESSVDLDIPNAFTPNGDEANDTWQVKPVVNANQFDKAVIKVYTNKGLLIFESKGFDTKWDGSFNGETLPVGTYYYTIDLKLSYTKRTYKGTVTILR
jgi:gliding motility-associated-like protein